MSVWVIVGAIDCRFLNKLVTVDEIPRESRYLKASGDRDALMYWESWYVLVQSRTNQRGKAYLVSDLPSHISLSSLEQSKSFAKIELNIVTFTFHAYSK